MTGISSAGGELKLPIGQSPRAIEVNINRELQKVYNAIHTTNGYLTALREEFEGTDSQDPSQSLKFRRLFWGDAGAKLSAGDVCCTIGNKVYPGVGTNDPLAESTNPGLSLWHRYYPFYTGLRSDFNLKALQFFIALTDAEEGERVKVGVGPGVVKIEGIECGTLVWALGAQGIVARANTTNGGPLGLFLVDRPLYNNGSMFANNITGTQISGTDTIYFEGIRLSGYPNESGEWVYRGTNYFYPIGICIKDDYVLISDHKEG